jgi:hypothetical protein
MKIKTVIVVSVAAVLAAAGSAVAFADLNAAVAPQTAVVAYSNSFEGAAADGPYLRSQWAAAGWDASWDLGMSNRSKVDSAVARSGKQSLRAFYPAGKVGPENSGISAPFSLRPSKEYYLSQWVRFSSDFSWGTTQYGGKIGMGLAAGKSCSGGQVCDGYNGFESRMIWRTGGRASLYYYHMGHAGTYGDYADFKDNGKDVYYQTGQWINLVQRVKINTVSNGQANPDGEIEVWVNGKRVAEVTGLQFVRNADLVDRAYLDSFFGGATEEFAPRNDSFIWYDDLKVSTQRADLCELAAGGCSAAAPVTPTTAPLPVKPTTVKPTTVKPTVTPTTRPTAKPTSTSPRPVPTATTAPAADTWRAWQPFATGQVVSYLGGRYTCLQAHTALPGWEPANVLALWRRA